MAAQVAPQTRLLPSTGWAGRGQTGGPCRGTARGHGCSGTPDPGWVGGALMVGKKPAAHEDLGEILFLNADLQFFKQ